MQLNPLTCIDFYKADHRRQYPPGTSLVYSNLTPRSSHLSNVPKELFTGNVVFFGLQYFIKHFLIEAWQKEFFAEDKATVLAKYKRRMDNALGPDAIPMEHIAALHDLGYLPIEIRALPEGTLVPMKVPVLTIHNTHNDFFWLTNYLETVMSSYLWKPLVSATTAYHYRKLLTSMAQTTGAPVGFVPFQGHDFSCRGMSGPYDAALSGAAHLTSFVGTDTVSAIDLVEQYYGGDCESELLGCSVPATEHSVMCMGEEAGEYDTIKRLITELYPKGIVSIVSDTWDFWNVITKTAGDLKTEIMARDGKVVFRPDSGDPVKIICGDPDAPNGSPAWRGAVECLWNIFGGKFNAAGFRELDPHVGLIYGDSITLERANAILSQLRDKKFASNNIVLGIGSFTYQHVTRDTYGLAVKSTYGVVNGKGRPIFKNPKTDNGMKKSAKGLLKVVEENGQLVCKDELDQVGSHGDCLMKLVFRDGVEYNTTKFSAVRERLWLKI